MAQTSTVQATLGDSFREVAGFFDRFPSLTAAAQYPGVPMVTHFITERTEQVEAVAKLVDATATRSVDPITGDVTTFVKIDFGDVELVVMHTEPMARELRRPVGVTEQFEAVER